MLFFFGFFCRNILLVLQVRGSELIPLELLLAEVEQALLLFEFLLSFASSGLLLLLDRRRVGDGTGAGSRGGWRETLTRDCRTEARDSAVIWHTGDVIPAEAGRSVGSTLNDELCGVSGRSCWMPSI